MTASRDRILITGATGNVGGEVFRLLKEKGSEVYAATQKPLTTIPPQDQILFDFSDSSTFSSAFEGVKKIFLIRPPALSDVERYFSPVISAAMKSGVELIVFLSLLGAEKNKVVPHRGIEDLILHSGLSWTFLRPSFFMQNLSTTHAPEIRDHDDIFIPAGNGRTGFIDLRDIAAVAVKTLTELGHTGKAYSLTGSEALTYSEVADILSRELGRRITYSNPSLLRFAFFMRKKGFAWAHIVVMCGIYTINKIGLAGTLTDDTKKLLSREPSSFEEFAHQARDCWL